MHDIASQLVLKWARLGPTHKIQASEDFSRLTLDTIALCSMDYRFNSFYQEEMHPFVKAMNTTLGAANNSGQLAGLITRLFPSYNEEVKQSSKFMEDVSQELVQYRRDHPTEKKDLLNALIYGKDPKTGKAMRDGLIAANMQTFLVAGESVVLCGSRGHGRRADHLQQVMRQHLGYSPSPSCSFSRTQTPTSPPRPKSTR
jgi:cytochrome P450 / NADPH-cytochrome P450 reductase